jgi:chromosome segregation ATPase
VNLLRNWIENWLFGDRLREVEDQVMSANDHYDDLRERCADIENEYATDQALSDLSQKIDDLESELKEFKRRARVAEKMILEQKKQIESTDLLLADHITRCRKGQTI